MVKGNEWEKLLQRGSQAYMQRVEWNHFGLITLRTLNTKFLLQGWCYRATCYVGNPYSRLVHTLKLVPSSCTLYICQPELIVSTVQLA